MRALGAAVTLAISLAAGSAFLSPGATDLPNAPESAAAHGGCRHRISEITKVGDRLFVRARIRCTRRHSTVGVNADFFRNGRFLKHKADSTSPGRRASFTMSVRCRKGRFRVASGAGVFTGSGEQAHTSSKFSRKKVRHRC